MGIHALAMALSPSSGLTISVEMARLALGTPREPAGCVQSTCPVPAWNQYGLPSFLLLASHPGGSRSTGLAIGMWTVGVHSTSAAGGNGGGSSQGGGRIESIVLCISTEEPRRAGASSEPWEAVLCGGGVLGRLLLYFAHCLLSGLAFAAQLFSNGWVFGVELPMVTPLKLSPRFASPVQGDWCLAKLIWVWLLRTTSIFCHGEFFPGMFCV